MCVTKERKIMNGCRPLPAGRQEEKRRG